MGPTPRHEVSRFLSSLPAAATPALTIGAQEAMLGELLQEVNGASGCPLAVDSLCRALSAGFSDKRGSRVLVEDKVWECLWPDSCRGQVWTMQATKRVGQDMHG